MHIRSATTLYFIRHGETPSNAKHITQGVQIDDYLDTTGILQVEKIAGLIRSLDLDILFTSYLHRAEETTAIIDNNLKEPVPVFHDFRLRERDFGSLTGKTSLEWDQRLPNHKELELLQIYDYRPFGGEDVAEVRKRAMGAMFDMIQNHTNQNIGVITHDGIIRLMLFHFPEIVRIYHTGEGKNLDIANTDIYEWQMEPNTVSTIRSLII